MYSHESPAAWVIVAIILFACVTAAVAVRAIRRYGFWESGSTILIASGGAMFSVFDAWLVSGYFCILLPIHLGFFLILIGRMQEAKKHL